MYRRRPPACGTLKDARLKLIDIYCYFLANSFKFEALRVGTLGSRELLAFFVFIRWGQLDHFAGDDEDEQIRCGRNTTVTTSGSLEWSQAGDQI